MGELELVGLHDDGEHLVLAGADGQRFRLRIDETLRAAVRRDRPQFEQLRAEQAGALSPREIQSRVRAGQSAEEIADDCGLSVESVRRYEGPVLAEREFIVDQARATRVGRDPGAPVLGDLVLDRLAARGVEPDSLTWDAHRERTGPWTVVARFAVEDSAREARWTYDPAKRVVLAEEDEARWLSETELSDGPIPRRHLAAVRDMVFDIEADGAIRPVLADVDTQAGEPDPEPDPDEATHTLLDDLRSRRGVRQPLDLEDDDEDFEGFGPQHAFDFGQLDTSVPGAHPVDADAHAEAVVFPVPDSARSIDPTGHPSQETPAAADPAAAPSTPSGSSDAPDPARERPRGGRKARAKVPSWD